MRVCACVVLVYEYSCLKICKVTCNTVYVDFIVVSFEVYWIMHVLSLILGYLSTDRSLAKFALLVCL